MMLKDVSEIEEFINTLNKETQLHMAANVNFLIINFLSQQKNLDIFSFVNKFIGLLTIDNQTSLLNDINLLADNFNRGLPLDEVTAFTPEGDASFLNSSNESEYDSNISTPPASLVEKMQAQAAALMSNPQQDNYMNTNIPGFTNIPGLTGPLQNNKAAMPTNNANIPQENLITASAPSMVQQSSLTSKDFLPITEGIKYLTPQVTEKVKEINLPIHEALELYATLKQFNDGLTLYQIYVNNYKDINLMSFLIDYVLPNSIKNLVSFQKSPHLPIDRKTKLRLGELLLSLNLLDEEKLRYALEAQKEEEKLLSQKGATSVPYDIAAFETPKNPRRLLGDFLLGLQLLNRQQLECALAIQKWYNSIISLK